MPHILTLTVAGVLALASPAAASPFGVHETGRAAGAPCAVHVAPVCQWRAAPDHVAVLRPMANVRVPCHYSDTETRTLDGRVYPHPPINRTRDLAGGCWAESALFGETVVLYHWTDR